MKPETLESLLIDRTLKELAPEVGELLDAYLAQNPAAAATASQFEETVDLARRAVPVPKEVPCRKPAIEPVSRPTWWDWFAVPRIELVRLACCLALGLALGLSVSSLWKVPVVVSAPSAKPIVMANASGNGADRSSAQFWSLTEVAADRQKRSQANQAANRERLQWDSLFKMPRLEEN